eukprot:447880-Hanusia_phi.AAC.2
MASAWISPTCMSALGCGKRALTCKRSTTRIIAMGYPSEGMEGSYRNHADDVYRFFETRRGAGGRGQADVLAGIRIATSSSTFARRGPTTTHA